MARSWASAALVACLLAACGPAASDVPVRDCAAVIWARSHAGGAPQVVASWDGWTTPGQTMQAEDDGWYALRVAPPVGQHGYLIVDGAVARIDEYNPLTRFRQSDGREVSHLEIDDCAQPGLDVEDVELRDGRVFASAQFWAADVEPQAPLDPDRVGGDLDLDQASSADGTIEVTSAPLSRGRHELELRAADTAGREAGARISVFVDPIAPTWSDAIVYQVMIDRFYADDGAALAPPPTPGSRAGGTLGGVEAALESGYFEALGVSALWISPVYQNPEDAREGTDGHLYEGYHGYWNARDRSVDARIGGGDALRSLIAAAHERGVAVILDVVPNHVYETHAIVAAHRDDGWFNEHDDACVCGTPSCPWAEFMQDCWFAPYLPDIRVEHPDAIDYAVGELLWWLDAFALDGLRIDAVPMMPRAASRRIAHEVRRHTAPGRDRLLLGEVFTGPGTAGVAGLRHYLGPDGLDSVFDFPLMWAIRDVLGPAGQGFSTFDALLDHIDDELAGSGAVLGRMLGNHDVVRFTTALTGDEGGDPWQGGAAQPTGETPADAALLDRVKLGLTLQLTLPGMPVLYYGDELALAGGRDPDNRRIMPALDSLSPARLDVLAHARTLGALRRCSDALRGGARETLHVGDDTYAYARAVEGGPAVVVVISRADEPRIVALPTSAPLSGPVVDALSGAALALAGGATIELGPREARVLLAADDPCLNPQLALSAPRSARG